MQGISKYSWERVAGKFYVNYALVCEFHFNLSNISISIGAPIKPLKLSTVLRFHEIKKGPVDAKE